LAVASFFFLMHALIALLFPFSLDYGEAPLVDQARRLAAGENIYRADLSIPPYNVANYPPLYVVAMAPLVRLLGPTYAAGRLISLVSALVTALLIGLLLNNLGADRGTGVTSALFFLAIPFVVSWAPLARVDMLALALGLGGLYALTGRPTANTWRMLGAALLLAAIFTRQSYALAAPLAGFVWLWSQDRRWALAFALILGTSVLAIFALLNLLTQGGLFLNVISANVNTFDLEQLDFWWGELRWTLPILLLMGVVFVIVGPRRSDNVWTLMVPYLAGALGSALTIGKIGSNKNYLLELCVALTLATGLLLSWSRGRRWLHVGLVLLMIWQVGIFLGTTLDGPVRDLSFRTGRSPQLEEMKDLVAAAANPILADEQMGLAVQLGQPLYLQPFEMTQLALAGRWDQIPLLESIAAHRFPYIFIYQFPFSSFLKAQRWTPDMLSAIYDGYVALEMLDGNMLFEPKWWTPDAEIPSPVLPESIAPAARRLGTPVSLGGARSVVNPHIAANPAQPDHLAASVAATSEPVCDAPGCRSALVTYTSIDGGATWREQTAVNSAGRPYEDGMATFGPDGALYTLLLDEEMWTNRSVSNSLPSAYTLAVTQTARVGDVTFHPEPWLQVDPRDGDLFISYVKEHQRTLQVSLLQSGDTPSGWLRDVDLAPGVLLDHISSGQAIPPLGPQLLFGPGDRTTAVWVWRAGFWEPPFGIWVTNSDDGGQSFSRPRQIGHTWGLVSAVSQDGTYYVVYKTGPESEPRLALATSRDGGETWSSVLVSGELALETELLNAPGIDVAPDGTIDLSFYAPSSDAGECVFSIEDWRWILYGGRWSDPCAYDAYYVYSRDGGRTFSAPLRLNAGPIVGERFAQVGGGSVAAFRLGMASTDAAAYPLWIETQGSEGTQLLTVRIGR
jgi:hypothetical protein